jgi:hypothetical protein
MELLAILLNQIILGLVFTQINFMTVKNIDLETKRVTSRAFGYREVSQFCNKLFASLLSKI